MPPAWEGWWFFISKKLSGFVVLRIALIFAKISMRWKRLE